MTISKWSAHATNVPDFSCDVLTYSSSTCKHVIQLAVYLNQLYKQNLLLASQAQFTQR